MLVLEAELLDLGLGAFGEGGDALVRESHPLGLAQSLGGQRLFPELPLHLHQVAHLAHEELVPLGPGGDLRQRHAPADGLGHDEEALVGGDLELLLDHLVGPLLRLQVDRSISRERMAFMMPSSMVRPMAMTSPVDFIWVPSLLSTVRNLSKGQRGIFTTT